MQRAKDPSWQLTVSGAVLSSLTSQPRLIFTSHVSTHYWKLLEKLLHQFGLIWTCNEQLVAPLSHHSEMIPQLALSPSPVTPHRSTTQSFILTFLKIAAFSKTHQCSLFLIDFRGVMAISTRITFLDTLYITISVYIRGFESLTCCCRISNFFHHKRSMKMGRVTIVKYHFTS